MPSFDVVSEVNMQEVVNAIDQANREVDNRFDFKGSNARFELVKETVTLQAQNDFQLKQMLDIIQNKLVKRGIGLGSIKVGEPQININNASQVLTLQQGIETDLAKNLVKAIKNSKLKVQASIQGNQIRVSGAKRDDLQSVISLLREQKITLPLQFVNFRD